VARCAIDPDRLVFIDETWVKTNMTRTCGWCQRGQPLIAKVPHGHWKTLTFLAGLRRDSIVAPFVLDGPINGIAFTAWVQQCLVPTLKSGDVVILDNLGSHKGKPARDAIRDVGAHLFFLPPYSPDLNPIEMMFAKLKTLVRKAEERTVETTWRRIGELLKAFSPQECSNYLRPDMLRAPPSTGPRTLPGTGSPPFPYLHP
jgi:transposase